MKITDNLFILRMSDVYNVVYGGTMYYNPSAISICSPMGEELCYTRTVRIANCSNFNLYPNQVGSLTFTKLCEDKYPELVRLVKMDLSVSSDDMPILFHPTYEALKDIQEIFNHNFQLLYGDMLLKNKTKIKLLSLWNRLKKMLTG